MDGYESGQDFAARYWGGEGIVPQPVEATMSRRNPFDGGQYELPAGWAFRADGFGYRVWQDDALSDVWRMETSDGCFAQFWLVQQGTVPAQWCVLGLDGVRCVEARVAP